VSINEQILTINLSQLAPPVALIGFKMGLLGFVFPDTEALSLVFLQNNWVCFVI
jgi:hypothetical protein